MAGEPDYYSVLGVSPQSEEIVIQAAYRALMRRYHPDKNPSKEAQRKTIEINAAYAVLGDKAKRTAYDSRRTQSRADAKDSKGHENAAPPPPPPPPPTGKGAPKGGPDSVKAWEARRGGAGLIFASLLTITIIILVALGASNSSGNAGLNTMNVDENLTTTDMNAVDFNATDMNATDMNATDLNAAEAQLVPPDLSKLPQTAVTYSTVEGAADRVAKLIVTKGVAGARAYSEDCHKAVQTKPSWDGADGCAAFDYAAAYIDAAVSTQAGWPKNGYFDFQSNNQPDDYAAVGAPPYMTGDRLTKIRAAAQDAAAEAFRSEVARMHTDQASSAPSPSSLPENSSE